MGKKEKRRAQKPEDIKRTKAARLPWDIAPFDQERPSNYSPSEIARLHIRQVRRLEAYEGARYGPTAVGTRSTDIYADNSHRLGNKLREASDRLDAMYERIKAHMPVEKRARLYRSCPNPECRIFGEETVGLHCLTCGTQTTAALDEGS